jgi:large subunit ribosomal protein L31
MKEKIHPKHVPAKIICACGNVLKTLSAQSEIHIEICSACHPFYTGQKKVIDTAGRIDKFKERLAKTKKMETVKKEKAAKKKSQSKKKK